jgi:hypothetical protein
MSRGVDPRVVTPRNLFDEAAENERRKIARLREVADADVSKQLAYIARLEAKLVGGDLRPKGESGHFLSESSDPRQMPSQVQTQLDKAQKKLVTLEAAAAELHDHERETQA